MMRFNTISGLLIAAALAMGTGCAAETTSTDGTAQTAVDEVDSARPVFAHEARGTATATQGLGNATHPAFTNLGPSPDPWQGDNTGPSPDPWVPHARPAPDPGDPGNPSTNTGGAGGSSSNNK